MIRDRNIAKDAQISMTKIQGAGVSMVGDVHWVCKAAATAMYDWIGQRVDDANFHVTVDAAINACTASRGDTIIVAPGHTENLAAADAIDADVVGVSIIGLGNYLNRPTFTYTNAAGEIVIGANNVKIENIIMNASVTATLKAIDIETGALGSIIQGCLFGVDTAGTDEFNNAIIIGDQSNYTNIIDNRAHQGTAGAVSFIKSDADNDYARIVGNFVSGDYSTACIVGDEADDMIYIAHNVLYNGQETGIGLNAQPVIELASTTTGVIEYNRTFCNVATLAAHIVADDCHLHENYSSEDESGAATSAATSATRVVSADD